MTTHDDLNGDESDPIKDIDMWVRGYIFGVIAGTLLGLLMGVGIAQTVFCP